MERPYQLLLSLPPACASRFDTLGLRVPAGTFATHDPPGSKLGSGGGMANVLAAAWRDSGSGSFASWLGGAVRLVVHSGGESRRTPAYAAEGKVFTPMPVLRWSYGQRFDQTLLDVQAPLLEAVVRAASRRSVAAVYSGDVLLRGSLPEELPDADVVCVGLWESPEAAVRHGVFFCDRDHPRHLLFMLQKPPIEVLREQSREALFLVDSGLWLFSSRAVSVLMELCGWDGAGFPGGVPLFYDLYTRFGAALGSRPGDPAAGVSDLSVAVVALGEGTFYHLGTSRELVQTTLRLQNAVLDQRRFGGFSQKHPAIFLQNADVGIGLSDANHTLWIENASVAPGWRLAHSHVITGVPENDWHLRLPPGACLDMVPVEDTAWCVRFYAMDDAFRGPVGDPSARWLGISARHWFETRGLTPEACGIDPATDLQHAALFPVLGAGELEEGFVQWLLGDAGPWEAEGGAVEAAVNRPVSASTEAAESGGSPPAGAAAAGVWAERYRSCRRLSASELATQAALDRRAAQRRGRQVRALSRLARVPGHPVFQRLDLEHAASLLAGVPLESVCAAGSEGGLDAARVHMFRALCGRRRRERRWRDAEARAFGAMRELLVSWGGSGPALPLRHLLDDQIIWGRSPVRLDLAGGWTDTPPYCLVHGGAVVNMAVELNGQPPIQVFGRCTDRPEIVLRSIDLGRTETVTSFEQLRGYREVGNAFSIPKAALALAGFLPEFRHGGGGDSLGEVLGTFGGGIELTLMAAVPKGSGLGTSSILAATVLGTLSELCGLAWPPQELMVRTLVLEQLLTTGGGWQDQAGGIAPGVKLLLSHPGPRQEILVRWLPDAMLRRQLNGAVLLYYTGLTRVAKGILQEVVRGMFLNAAGPQGILERIGANALRLADALQHQDWERFCRCLGRSWELNCRLDAGTAPRSVRHLLAGVADHLEAAKLLGAGGGGYLLMVARNEEAAARVRRLLNARPLHPTARFVDMSISDSGLQVTRS
ncbi:MAG: bifunctional fucokinase/L-fucose-1-P-guanylyltransferase [Lentisphaeria bacterium]|nr:bifunctional fucokinase/L-fucose-1-P-guanylyltransferase [Lentisphaeria bacterium]